MFKSINREINQIINRGFDRTLRLAVTGLSRSGKTAFITSLINQLLHINQEGNAHLPLFEAARNQSILAVKRVPQQDLSIPRFDYEANLNDLMNNPPQWCQSTRGVSETRLAIRFERPIRAYFAILKNVAHYIWIFLIILVNGYWIYLC